jgi:DNA-directed RNA polymerase I subunit RPA1
MYFSGAVSVESETGFRKMVDGSNPAQREALAKTLLTSSSNSGGGGDQDENGGQTKYVYRHLINGDPMLLNRQPTLHKPSIMSHR